MSGRIEPARGADASGVDGIGPKADIGVLFVHGIGNQPRGETLVKMGEALYDWLSSWGRAKPPVTLYDWIVRGEPLLFPYRDTGTFQVDVTDAVLTEPDIGVPASARLSFREISGDRIVSEWLLAEGWWARSFNPASFRRVLAWALLIGPWMALVQYMTSISRITRWGWGSWLRFLPMLLGIVLALAKAFLLATGVWFLGLCLVVLALVPLQSVRQLVDRARSWLTDSIGDSRQLTEGDFQYEAMARQVVRALTWLEPRSKQLAVVAHSQGAAVADRALKAWQGQNIALYITFGSALNKVRNIRKGRGEGSFFLGLLSLIGFVTLPYLIVVLRALVVGDHVSGLEGTLAYFAGWAFLGLVGGLMYAINSAQRDMETLLEAPQKANRWRDYFSSKDPVPNGPLRYRLPDSITTTEVWNKDSVWSDHTTYWRNREGFVAEIACRLARIAQAPQPRFTKRDEVRFRRAGRRRRWRFQWRRRIAAIGQIGIALAVLGSAPSLRQLGQSVVNSVNQAATVPLEPIRTVSVGVASMVAALPKATLGGALVLLAGIVAYTLANTPWSVWAEEDERTLILRGRYRGGLGFLLASAFLNGILIAGGLAIILKAQVTVAGLSGAAAGLRAALYSTILPSLSTLFAYPLLLWLVRRTRFRTRMLLIEWYLAPFFGFWLLAGIQVLFPNIGQPASAFVTLAIVVVAAAMAMFIPVAWLVINDRLRVRSLGKPRTMPAPAPWRLTPSMALFLVQLRRSLARLFMPWSGGHLVDPGYDLSGPCASSRFCHTMPGLTTGLPRDGIECE